MIMHIQDHNGSNGSKPAPKDETFAVGTPEVGNSPPQVRPLPQACWDGSLVDPHLVESLANELYAAIPGRSSAAHQVNQVVIVHGIWVSAGSKDGAG
ncbi:MAG TPA: hypothetical protein V6C65_01080 [Allocoleopsis sp.]